jgi:hypothetical protein
VNDGRKWKRLGFSGIEERAASYYASACKAIKEGRKVSTFDRTVSEAEIEKAYRG